jgi:DNA-binding response OmpR family regulator
MGFLDRNEKFMIVLVTKNQSFFDTLAKRLRQIGKNCIGIMSLPDLWMTVRQQRPKIVILDVHDSQESPVNILRRLDAEGYGGQTIVLAEEWEDTLEHSKLGAIQIVGRPMSVNRILCAIRIAQDHLHVEKNSIPSTWIAECMEVE